MLLKIDTMKYYQIHFGNSEASLRCKRGIIKNNNMVLKTYNQETIEAMPRVTQLMRRLKNLRKINLWNLPRDYELEIFNLERNKNEKKVILSLCLYVYHSNHSFSGL